MFCFGILFHERLDTLRQRQMISTILRILMPEKSPSVPPMTASLSLNVSLCSLLGIIHILRKHTFMLLGPPTLSLTTWTKFYLVLTLHPPSNGQKWTFYILEGEQKKVHNRFLARVLQSIKINCLLLNFLSNEGI